MAIWLRVVLIVALAVLLWILVVDLTQSVDDASGSLGPPRDAASLA
jgi:hypothetical protein